MDDPFSLPSSSVLAATSQPTPDMNLPATDISPWSLWNACGTFMPGDTNFHRYFVGDLARWVASTVSPNNPNTHVPSDEEIQHQARWIMYDR